MLHVIAKTRTGQAFDRMTLPIAIETITTRAATPDDEAAVSALHAHVFGPGRFARTAYRVREGASDHQRPFSTFCRIAERTDGRLVAALKMTPVAIGNATGALLLGPLAVDPDFAGQGYGRQLVGEVIEEARAQGRDIVVLVGDEPYYGRFGFKRVPYGQIRLPGPVNVDRILAVALNEGALDRYRGLMTAL
ncbi:MAG: N-acetyltransferase [Hyphomicrobium sp.]|nr:N-acetyltransferase [Hyphomicrobium sp.]